MHDGNITIDSITKIEGTAGLDVTIQNGQVTDLKFIIKDYRRFYTEAVKGKPIIAVPSFLSRICGTCSLAHLFASLEAIEKSQGIELSQQSRLLRRLTYNGLIIRDHALHLYFFTMPDILGLESIFDIPDDPAAAGHRLLHDSFEIKKLGTTLSTLISGAAIHAPLPTIGGFLKIPDVEKLKDLLPVLEKTREAAIRGIQVFGDWPESLIRNSDYLALRNDRDFNFLDGYVLNSDGKKVPEEKFHDFLKSVVIPYSQAEGYEFSDSHEDYLVGALARVNLNKELLNKRTASDAKKYLDFFPSNNVYHNNLAQAIEILQCLDDSIEIINSLAITAEKPRQTLPRAGSGVGVIEAPRGILYHYVKVNDKGMVEDYDVIEQTDKNKINIENDLKKYFSANLDKDEETLRLNSEKIIRAYDPCMSCATNFLKINFIRR